jgi:hypothetical protein
MMTSAQVAKGAPRGAYVVTAKLPERELPPTMRGRHFEAKTFKRSSF